MASFSLPLRPWMFQLHAILLSCGIATNFYFIFPLKKKKATKTLQTKRNQTKKTKPKLLISRICTEVHDLVLICNLLESGFCWKPGSRAPSFATCFGFCFFFFSRQFIHPQFLVNLWLLIITWILPFLKGKWLKTMVTANKQIKQIELCKCVFFRSFFSESYWNVQRNKIRFSNCPGASSCVINNVFNHRNLIFRTCRTVHLSTEKTVN